MKYQIGPLHWADSIYYLTCPSAYSIAELLLPEVEKNLVKGANTVFGQWWQNLQKKSVLILDFYSFSLIF